jgi:hypothetical protein
VRDVADILEVHATSIFRVQLCRLVSCCVYVSFGFENERERGGGIEWGLVQSFLHSFLKPNAYSKQVKSSDLRH